jgi:hypothetical protein
VNRAVCARCGASRVDFREVCPACGFRPDGEAVLSAWLLSSAHFDDKQLDAAAERIKRGEPLRPTAAMFDRARRALGEDLSTDVGLSTGQRVGLLVVSLLLTPLPAWVMAVWWWKERPRAAIQALALAVPSSAVFVAGWFWAVFG